MTSAIGALLIVVGIQAAAIVVVLMERARHAGVERALRAKPARAAAFSERQGGVPGEENWREALDDLDALPDNMVDDYYHWLSVGMILHAESGGSERGFRVWNEWSRRSAKYDPEALAQEIDDNRARLEPIAKRRLHHFCYPSGVYERGIWPQLEALEIESATTIEQGINFAGAPPLGLKRLLDGQEVELIEFEAELCGFVELTRRLRRPFRRSAGGTTAAEHAAG